MPNCCMDGKLSIKFATALPATIMNVNSKTMIIKMGKFKKELFFSFFLFITVGNYILK